MASCPDIDPLLTPYVDGESGIAERAEVASHLDRCPPCRRLAAIESAARAVVRERATALASPAPAGLRERCRHAMGASGAAVTGLGTRRSWFLAMAATVLLTLVGVVGYGLIARPTEALAAQLTLDHLKCFALADGAGPVSAAAVEADFKRRYGWDVRLPEDGEVPGLTLVAGRRCVNLDGAVAHVLYRQGLVPVSLFVLPPDVNMQGEVAILGHQAVMFRRGGRTYVVLSRESRSRVEQVARYFEQDIR